VLPTHTRAANGRPKSPIVAGSGWVHARDRHYFAPRLTVSKLSARSCYRYPTRDRRTHKVGHDQFRSAKHSDTRALASLAPPCATVPTSVNGTTRRSAQGNDGWMECAGCGLAVVAGLRLAALVTGCAAMVWCR
jgi:hypothetical protein